MSNILSNKTEIANQNNINIINDFFGIHGALPFAFTEKIHNIVDIETFNSYFKEIFVESIELNIENILYILNTLYNINHNI